MQNTTTQRASILVKLHEQSSRELDLVSDSFTIGRKADNDLPIEDSAVSAHHAQITKIHAVYFIEDLKSTNGTFVNDKRIDRHQLKDTDVITIGRHRIIFRDPTAAAMAPSNTPPEDLDKTMVLTGQARPDGAGTSSASLRVLSGRTDHQEYPLNRQIIMIGSDPKAAVKLTGWFAPKTAAMISRRQDSYFVSRARNGKTLLVNGQEVTGEKQLKDKDRIEVAGATLLFRADSERRG